MATKNIQKIEVTVLCPECGSNYLNKDEYRAELVCDDCGLVIEEDLIDHRPEWRAFDSDQREKKARTGSPMTPMIHDKGLSTNISWQNKDSYGRSIPTRNRAQIYRLRKWQKRTRISGYTERNLSFALSALNRMSSGMSLPRTVRETAAMIYRKAVLKNLIRGRSIEGVTAAAVYAACKQCHVPRTLYEISNVAQIQKREIGRAYRFIVRELELKLMPTLPQDYIPRFCSKLKLTAKVQGKALEILKEAAERQITSGRNPTSFAATSIYIASVLCCERRTQREIADVAGVSEVTIRNRYKELAEKLDIHITL